MSREELNVVRHLPYLRRYARALCGNQEYGDQYVRITLETLLEEPERMNSVASTRQGLYKLFHEVWMRLAERLEHGEAEVDHGAAPIESHIHNLDPRERQVLLLTAIENFTLEEAAEILNLDAAQTEQLLKAARLDLNEQAATTVLIIEDEPIIAFDINRIVSDMGHKVLGTAATKDEAVAIAAKARPGIVLADIQLGDGSSGIDAVSEILERLDVPVIFVTAYPERLLTGQQTEPAYLVTKPFEPDTLKVTIYQALLSGRKPPLLRAVG